MQLTNKAKRERIERLENRLHDLKAGVYMGKRDSKLATMLHWFTQTYWKMPPQERVEIKEMWDQYYKDCNVRPLRAGFDLITAPAGYDPMIWDQSDFCQQYRWIESELRHLGADDNEFEQHSGGTW